VAIINANPSAITPVAADTVLPLHSNRYT
jgi:hypothetical protein